MSILYLWYYVIDDFIYYYYYYYYSYYYIGIIIIVCLYLYKCRLSVRCPEIRYPQIDMCLYCC